jgi:hypothetical protein
VENLVNCSECGGTNFKMVYKEENDHAYPVDIYCSHCGKYTHLQDGYIVG